MTDSADRWIAGEYGLGDHPVMNAEWGSDMHRRVIEYPGDYETEASLVLVSLTDEVKRMSRPELERALITGSVISVEVIPTPEEYDDVVRLQEGNALHAETTFLGLPGKKSVKEEVGQLFVSVTDPDQASGGHRSVWGVSHYTDSKIASEYREAVSKLDLYDGRDEPCPDRVEEAVEELYA